MTGREFFLDRESVDLEGGVGGVLGLVNIS